MGRPSSFCLALGCGARGSAEDDYQSPDSLPPQPFFAPVVLLHVREITPAELLLIVNSSPVLNAFAVTEYSSLPPEAALRYGADAPATTVIAASTLFSSAGVTFS